MSWGESFDLVISFLVSENSPSPWDSFSFHETWRLLVPICNLRVPLRNSSHPLFRRMRRGGSRGFMLEERSSIVNNNNYNCPQYSSNQLLPPQHMVNGVQRGNSSKYRCVDRLPDEIFLKKESSFFDWLLSFLYCLSSSFTFDMIRTWCRVFFVLNLPHPFYFSFARKLRQNWESGRKGEAVQMMICCKCPCFS